MKYFNFMSKKDIYFLDNLIKKRYAKIFDKKFFFELGSNTINLYIKKILNLNFKVVFKEENHSN